MGVQWVSYVVGPITVLVLTVVLSMTAFGLGSGRGWGVSTALPGAFAGYFVCVLWGVALGGLMGFLTALVLRVIPAPLSASLRAATRRPISVSPMIPGTATRVGIASVRKRPRRWPWLVLIAILLVQVGALGAGAYVGHAVDHRLADAASVADRDDPYWRLDALMAQREKVPETENSASVVAEALALLPNGWPSAEWKERFARLTATADNVQLDDETVEMLRGELTAQTEAVRTARTVADYRRGHHELELGPTLLDTPLPETMAARTIARLLATDAAVRAQDGDLDGAIDSCCAILGVGRSIGDEPFLLSQRVRAALGAVAVQSARRTLGQGQPSPAALARFHTLILDELAEPLLLQGLKGERATTTELIRRVGNGEVRISALGAVGVNPDIFRPFATTAPWGKLLFDYQRAIEMEWMNTAVAIARRPAAEQPALWKTWQADIDSVRQSKLAMFSATLPLLLSPSARAAIAELSRYQAELGATAILLAAERHRRTKGDWPESIAAIDPAILSSPPVDPFSGQPFRMERRDGNFLIYSVGPNGKDEHGNYDPRHWRDGVRDDVGTKGWDVSRRRQTPPRS